MYNLDGNTLFKSKEEIIMYKKQIEKNKSKTSFITFDGKKYKLKISFLNYLYFDLKDEQARIYVRATDWED